MTKQRQTPARPFRCVRAMLLVGVGLQTFPAIAQQTVYIGGPRPGPAVEVDLSILNKASTTPAARKKTSLPDLLPPDAANLPAARSTSSRRLSPPPKAEIAKPRIPDGPRQVTNTKPEPMLATPAPLTPGLLAAPTIVPQQAGPSDMQAAAPPKPLEVPKAPSIVTPSKPQTLAALPTFTPAFPPGAGVNAAMLFAPGAIDLSVDAKAQLDGLISLLKPRDRVQLKSHAAGAASDAEARRMALKRALAARSHLLANGIDSTRIDVRALGPAADGGSDDRIDVIVLSP